VAGNSSGFATAVVKWQARNGRNDLPWQQTGDPYHVWLSEVMLQQTQVATVKAYFQRFIVQCPDVAALARASQDEVMGLWSGLGYYSRARNLHRCAQEIMERFGGVFPRQVDALVSLPGIGRSTAAAIASLCFGARAAILDANVKRVVTRVAAFEGDLAKAVYERELWTQAEALLPQKTAYMRGYTQGMMDLGALVCLPKNPHCAGCPVQSHCKAFGAGDPQRYPVRSRKLKRSSESLWLLMARTASGDVWLSRRPAPGVWAGLHCLPLFASAQALEEAVPCACRPTLVWEAAFLHVLTHKDLHLHVVRLEGLDDSVGWDYGQCGQWVAATDWPRLGLPAPIRKLLTAPGAA
jgi:A/G-specific adenine glycosylase